MGLPSLPSGLRRPGRRHRRAWAHGGRAHIEARSASRPGSRRLAERVREDLERLEGVHWARVNGVVGRVVVAFDDESLDLRDLVDVVEAVEEALGVDSDLFSFDRPEHPGDIEPVRRALAALAADVAGLGLAVAGTAVRSTPLPLEVASIVTVIEAEPRLRRLVANVVGPPAADVGLALANAVAQGLAQGPIGLVVDMAHRASILTEAQARRRVWREREPELGQADAVAADPVPREPRPRPLPGGPVETYADRAALAALGGFAFTLLATRDPRRAGAGLLAGIPKAARLGREAFAAQLDRSLSARGVIVFDAEVLRRLDRIDAVVVEQELVRAAPAEADALVEAGHDASCMVAVAGDDVGVVEDLDADLLIDGPEPLAEKVRQLQADGCVVAVVSAGDTAALRAADCGIGVIGASGVVPWGADVLCKRGLEDAVLLVDACTVAHEVSRQSAALALAGSSVASVAAIVGRSPGAGRALTGVNIAALVALANGTRAGLALARRQAPQPERPRWHSLDVDAVFSELGSTVEGLSEEEAVSRRLPTDRTSPAPLRLARAMAEELANPLTPVLAGAAALSAAVGSSLDAVMVGAVSGFNAVLGGAQRFQAQQAIRALEERSSVRGRVRRGNEVTMIEAEDVVPGDVVLVEAGDVIPADSRIVSAENLEVDESSLTGESAPVVKTAAPTSAPAVADRTSMLYGGTTVAAGTAEAVVVAVGRQMEAAADTGHHGARPDGVEARLGHLSALTLPAAAIGGIGVVGAGLLRGRPVRQTLGTAVSLAVAAVPEGLPILATVAQLAAARRLSTKGALVRNPRAIEALGRAEVICTDKTGTLTQGHIELTRVSDGETDVGTEALDDAHLAVVAAGLRATPANGNGRALPHLTDRAVLEGAERAGVDERADRPDWERGSELPFEPARGYHATAGRTEGGGVLSVKGAPEVVLPRCRRWAGHELTAERRRRLDEIVDGLARSGHRLLAVAERSIEPGAPVDEEQVSDLTLLGFLALADPVRPEAARAVRELRAAGVEVVMVTGDHPSTAEGIAVELGILNGGRVLTGEEVDDLADPDLDGLLPHVSVFARVSPAHKVRIVAAYQRAGKPVAMTGDGANDAPAIRLADVGVALGAQSTPAARNAADLVVTDERIETIIEAVIEGRAMWGSVRDALAILIGGNLGEIAFTVGASTLTGRAPLSTRQLLLVNLLTDVAPALAIAVRPPANRAAEDLAAEGPERSLGAALDRAILLRAGATTLGASAAWGIARVSGGPRRANTVGLVALVGTQLGQTLVTGGRNPAVIAASVGSAAVLAGVVQTPVLSQFFGCTPLDPVAWTIAAGSAAAGTGLSVAIPLVGRLVRSGA